MFKAVLLVLFTWLMVARVVHGVEKMCESVKNEEKEKEDKQKC
ncbi:hypothetical protein [Clostridium felsineum]|nr:hypothetical protein [Clostridium felsineum]URZ16900.1 hypothetical protein CLFE_029470 [Clostridium felsineum DSM 794]